MKKRYAVNIGDMTQDKIISQILISPYVDDFKTIVKAEKTLDGAAVLLVPEVEREIIDNIVSVIRMRFHKNLFRVYEGSEKLKGWKRI